MVGVASAMTGTLISVVVRAGPVLQHLVGPPNLPSESRGSAARAYAEAHEVEPGCPAPMRSLALPLGHADLGGEGLAWKRDGPCTLEGAR